MSVKFDDIWLEVAEALTEAKAIAFDGCHKIYVLQDHAQVDLMLGYGYGYDEGSHLVHSIGSSPEDMLATLQDWYRDSCGLRFIQAVETKLDDPNEGFSNLIPQGYEEEFCKGCESYGANIDGLCDDCQDENERYVYGDEEEEEEEEEE
jgi:hypothetical protein